jgi:hypothetical protein
MLPVSMCNAMRIYFLPSETSIGPSPQAGVRRKEGLGDGQWNDGEHEKRREEFGRVADRVTISNNNR